MRVLVVEDDADIVVHPTMTGGTWGSRPQEAFIENAAAGIMVLLALLLAMNGVAAWLRDRYRHRRHGLPAEGRVGIRYSWMAAEPVIGTLAVGSPAGERGPAEPLCKVDVDDLSVHYGATQALDRRALQIPANHHRQDGGPTR